MRFGIFDHLDDSGLPLSQHFEARLKLIEAYDRAGFYGYHLAEHHNTPLGYAPSPGVFLAAVAQRTRQLRFGPMVYLLPLYHPLRLIDDPGRGQAVDRAICRGGHAGLCRSLIGKIPKRIVSPFRRPRGTGGHAQPSRSP